MLTNTFKAQRQSVMMMKTFNFRCFSAAKEYDVAVIGGGPGGKFKHLKLKL